MMASQPRLSVLDKLLNSTGFATIGRAVRDSIVAFGTTEETLQDKFTVFEYRHVHRDDWANFRADVARRCARMSSLEMMIASHAGTGGEFTGSHG